MRFVSICLMGLFLVSCKSKPTLLSQQAFAKVYLDSLSKRFPDAHFELHPNFTITSSKGTLDYQIAIDNAYTEYKAAPDALPAVLAKYTGIAAELFAPRQPIKPDHIIAVIKPASYRREIMNMGDKSKPFDIAGDAYNEELMIAYAEDMKSNIRYLEESDLRELSIPRDSLRKMAVQNLEKLIPKMELQGENGLYGVLAGGDYEACLILLPSLWTKERLPVDGDFVVGIPNRDMLLVTGSNNKAGVDKVKEFVANSYKTRSYPVSEHLFKWNGTKFTHFQ